MDEEMEEYEMLSCVHGYHVYYSIWDSCIGKMLCCESDRCNPHDRFTVSIKKDDIINIIVGHLATSEDLIFRMCIPFSDF